MRSLLGALLALALLPLALAVSATGPRVLVVLDEPAHEARFSRLFGALRQQLGLDVAVRGARDDKPRLTEFGQRSFDHLLLLAPAAKALSADLSPQELVSFLKNGGNVLFGLAPSFAESYRDLAREFALEFEPRSSLLVDHFRALAGSSEGASNDSSILLGPATQDGGIVPNAHVFDAEALQAAQQQPLLFSGVAHRVGPNPMAFPLIRAPSSSYSKTGLRAEGDEPATAPLTGADADAALVSGFQLKDNSARAIWSGSIDLFADESSQKQARRTRDGQSYTSTANLPVSLALISWLTQSHGVLRVAQTSHERVRAGPHDERPDYEEWVDEVGGAVQRMYRVKDHVTFNLDLSRHDPVQGWVPAPRDLDLQVSLVMLDPFITAPLVALDAAPSSKSGALGETARSSAAHTRYSSTFQLPDRHGVYTFRVEWARHGWSYVSTRDVAPVRPFNHDEHPRGLSAAWPYVGGAFSTMLAFAVFVVLWTLTTEKSRPRAGKEE